MALRTVRTDGDPVLEKKCKEVKIMTPRLKTLIEDMMETMYEENGVGLAAPQVGVLRRIVVIDCSSEEQPDDGPFVLWCVKRSMRRCSRSVSWRRIFWPGRSAMNWIIWRDISIRNWLKENCATCSMPRRNKG